ncbi:MAG: hypothetical protein Q8J69_11165 [Sphingobacteriaceae bacterium]|nr:hypothetical protein [Sphingobacteriaceae bacterium]
MNEFLAIFHRSKKQNLIKAKLQAESKLVASTSMKILKEFEELEGKSKN